MEGFFGHTRVCPASTETSSLVLDCYWVPLFLLCPTPLCKEPGESYPAQAAGVPGPALWSPGWLACGLCWPSGKGGLDNDSFVLLTSSVPHIPVSLSSKSGHPQSPMHRGGSPRKTIVPGLMASESWGTSWMLEEIHQEGSSPSWPLLYLGVDLRPFVKRHQEGKLGDMIKEKIFHPCLTQTNA